jgi:DNA-binding NtrC family response regulator
MSASSGKILVVEDDDVQREGLLELLRLWGYEARAASDGWQALHEISSSSFDVVLSDADMPDMNGIGLLRELQRNFFLGSCIIISGHDDELEESEAVRHGARSFLRKPICPEQLKAEMRKCVEARRENESIAPAAIGHEPNPILVEKGQTGRWSVTN